MQQKIDISQSATQNILMIFQKINIASIYTNKALYYGAIEIRQSYQADNETLKF